MPWLPFENDSFNLADGTQFVPREDSLEHWRRSVVCGGDGLLFIMQTHVYLTQSHSFIRIDHTTGGDESDSSNWTDSYELQELDKNEASNWFDEVGKPKPEALQPMDCAEPHDSSSACPESRGVEVSDTQQNLSSSLRGPDGYQMVLNNTEAAIVCALGKLSPATTIKLADLRQHLPSDVSSGATAVKDAVKKLEHCSQPSLIRRPRGRNSGVQLTDAGQKLFEALQSRQHRKSDL